MVWARVPKEAAVSSCWWVVELSQGWTGAGKFTSEVTHLPVWELSGNCWQEASTPFHGDPSVGLPEHPHSVAASFPEREPCEREQGGSDDFQDWPQRSHSDILSRTVGFTGQLSSVQRRLHKVVNSQT